MCDKLISVTSCPSCGATVWQSDLIECSRCGEKLPYIKLNSNNIALAHSHHAFNLTDLYIPVSSPGGTRYYSCVKEISIIQRDEYDIFNKFMHTHKDEYICWDLPNMERLYFSKKYPITKVLFAIEYRDATRFRIDIDFFVNNKRIISYPLDFNLAGNSKQGITEKTKVFNKIIEKSLTSLSVLPKPKESTYFEYYPHKIVTDFKNIIDSFEKEHPEEYSSLKLLEEIEKDNN